MSSIGYVILFCNQDLIDDAQERWEDGWAQVLALPRDSLDYDALCSTMSNICPVPGVN